MPEKKPTPLYCDLQWTWIRVIHPYRTVPRIDRLDPQAGGPCFPKWPKCAWHGIVPTADIVALDGKWLPEFPVAIGLEYGCLCSNLVCTRSRSQYDCRVSRGRNLGGRTANISFEGRSLPIAIMFPQHNLIAELQSMCRSPVRHDAMEVATCHC